MCGIVGIVSESKDCLKKLQEGLCALEYRGYDSAGITFFVNNKFKTIKNVGSPKELFDGLDLKVKSNVGIAHTRWATHGKPDKVNAHPHLSEKGLFSVVHNGIIENYRELKDSLLSGVNFKSQTDSEVISNLLEYFYSGDVLSAIKNVTKVLDGCYALAIMCKDDKDKIYFARKNMSLLIGINNNERYLSSDLSAFSKECDTYLTLPNNSYGFIQKNKEEIFNFNNEKVCVKVENIENKAFLTKQGKFNYFMEKEIYEIKAVLQDTILCFKENKFNFKDKEFFQNIKYIKIIACGTSYHASLVGEKLFDSLGIMSNAEIASEFIYRKPYLPENTLAIFVSQSGETADTLAAIKVAKSLGAKTLGITNVKNSAVDRECDESIYLHAGVEKAVASTKAYNAQVLTFYLLKNILQKPQNKEAEFIDVLEQNIKKLNIKTMHKNILPVVALVKNSKNIFVVGRNFDYITSLEASLKIKEITYLNCEGFAAGELKHGTLALIETNSVVIAYITEKNLIDKTLNIVAQAKSRGAKIVIISQFNLKKLVAVSDYFIKLANFSEQFMPIVSIIPIQLLAYETSLALKHNPDKPRNLAKSVTVE